MPRSRFRSAALSLPVTVLLGLCAAHADDSNTTVNAFDELQRGATSDSTLTVCHGFGCRLQSLFELQPSDRATMSHIVHGAGSPAAERSAIAALVAWFDRRVGPIAGTQHHIARASGANVVNTDSEYDCIDTSHNVTALLLVLADMHLLRHHRVEQPVSRPQPHTTAVVTEIATGRQWAIDAWTHAAGERPDVMPLDQWFTHGE